MIFFILICISLFFPIICLENNYQLGHNFSYIVAHTCKDNLSREGDLPFLSGDTFRAYADHIYDETNATFKSEKVKIGDTIFVISFLLFDFFANEHPKIKQPYILITHNSYFYAPGEFIKFLNDPKIFMWFGVNKDSNHSKFIAIPLGLCSKYRRPYKSKDLMDLALTSKTNLCYCNFNLSTNYNLRKLVKDYFCDKNFVIYSEICEQDVYLNYAAKSKFLISPQGRGMDCFRTWECFYLNTIPIVKSSFLDELYDDLPALIINNWEEVTEAFLENQYDIIQSKKNSYNYKKLNFGYWSNLIDQAKNSCKSNYS